MRRNKVLLLFFLMAIMMNGLAQKTERETRIKEEETPHKAVAFVNEIKNKKHVKWYSEKTSGVASFESKFKHKGKFYSVEFDTLGNVEDVEVIVKLKNIDEGHSSAIKKKLLNEFEKLKYIKIQKQFTGEEKNLIEVFSGSEDHLDLNYEIEAEVKTGTGDWKMLEILIDPTGEIQRKREITIRPTDNLNY